MNFHLPWKIWVLYWNIDNIDSLPPTPYHNYQNINDFECFKTNFENGLKVDFILQLSRIIKVI